MEDKNGKDWWHDSVPLDIREECDTRSVEADSEQHACHFIDFLDLGRIIKKNSTVLKQISGFSTITKKAALEQIDRLCRIGNKIKLRKVHATKDDLTFLTELAGLLEIGKVADDHEI